MTNNCNAEIHGVWIWSNSIVMKSQNCIIPHLFVIPAKAGIQFFITASIDFSTILRNVFSINNCTIYDKRAYKKGAPPFLFTPINKMTVVSISIQKINTSVNVSAILFPPVIS